MENQQTQNTIDEKGLCAIGLGQSHVTAEKSEVV